MDEKIPLSFLCFFSAVKAHYRGHRQKVTGQNEEPVKNCDMPSSLLPFKTEYAKCPLPTRMRDIQLPHRCFTAAAIMARQTACLSSPVQFVLLNSHPGQDVVQYKESLNTIWPILGQNEGFVPKCNTNHGAEKKCNASKPLPNEIV